MESACIFNLFFIATQSLYSQKLVSLCEFNQLAVTKDIVKKRVRDILDEYLEANNHRKTSERYAILDVV